MISSDTQYQKARDELEYLTHWLAQLDSREAKDRKGLTTASVRRMISRLQEELAEYEAAGVSTPPASEKKTQPDDAGIERQD